MFLFLLETLSAISFVTACDDGWISFGGSCYLFVDDLNKTWPEAAHHCSEASADLVSIESSEEDTFIRDHASRLFDCGRDTAVFWLGGTDDEIEGIWKWYSSNEPLVYSNWASGQPEGRTGEDCLEMTGKHNFSGWDDDVCTNAVHFICERWDTAVAYPSSKVCDDGWMSFGGSCYLFTDDIKENWTQAAHHCGAHGSHLAVVETDSEDRFLRDQLQKLVKCPPLDNVFWLGASDIESEGVWKWYTNHQPVRLFNWAPGQPENRSNEDCLVMTKDDNFVGWHDDGCNDRGHFICEKLTNFVDTIVG